MKMQSIQGTVLGVLIVLGSSLAAGTGQAGEVRSYSLTGPMYIAGGPQRADEVIADKVVVTRRDHFAPYGRGGHIEALPGAQMARSAAVASDSTADAPLAAVREAATESVRPARERFGRE